MTRPLGAHRKNTRNISGMNIIIRCCAGSPVAGIIRVCQNWLAPISSGVMNSGS